MSLSSILEPNNYNAYCNTMTATNISGVTGPTGPTGPAGNSYGQTGSIGGTGPTGSIGYTGYTGLRGVNGSATFADMVSAYKSAAQTITNISPPITLQGITGQYTTLSSNTSNTWSSSAGTLTIVNRGLYLATLSGQFTNPSTAAYQNIGFIINGDTEYIAQSGATINTSGAVNCVSGSININLDVGDVVQVGAIADQPCNIYNVYFTIYRIF